MSDDANTFDTRHYSKLQADYAALQQQLAVAETRIKWLEKGKRLLEWPHQYGGKQWNDWVADIKRWLDGEPTR